MEVSHGLFNWLSTMGIMNDGYIQKKKKQVIVVNDQARNAFLSGHVCYYALYNIYSSQGLAMTNSITGNPGEPCAPQIALYNWSVLTDTLGQIGYNLSEDARNLIANGDLPLLMDVMNQLYINYSGDPNAASYVNVGGVLRPVNPREGAVSVDQGLDRMKSTKKFSPEDDLERAKMRFSMLQEKKQREARRQEEEERKIQDMRARMSTMIDCEKFREDLFAPQEKLPVYKEYTNRGAVQYCHYMILEILDRIETGEAQMELQAKERARKEAKKAAKLRKLGGNRLVDDVAPVHVPRNSDHTTIVMCRDIVVQNIVNFALSKNVKQKLEERAKVRKREQKALREMMQRLSSSIEHAKVQKFEDAISQERERKKREEAIRAEKFAELRKLNRERAIMETKKSEEKNKEKELEKQLQEEQKERRDAELALYYAEQKSKVLEHQRTKERQKKEIERAKAMLEEQQREERKRLGYELNKKIQERELKRVQSQEDKSAAPASLTAYNLGTGDHAAYFGETLGWQYLTETEFDIAQVIQQVRVEPSIAIEWVRHRMRSIRNRSVWITDENGKSQPMITREGVASHKDAEEFLLKQKPVKPLGDISIGLTLAARQHAIDLVYHGKAEIGLHVGTDGSTVTQRVTKYGTAALRPGHAEMMFAIVLPQDVQLGPVDMVTSMLVDDGVPTRDDRINIFHMTMIESVGVGHAIATCGKYRVVACVILFCYSYLDKPVSWMSQAHHNALQVLAPPFLDGNRNVHESIKRKKDLYIASNVYVGLSAAVPDVSALYEERLGKIQHKLGVYATDISGADSSQDPSENEQQNATSADGKDRNSQTRKRDPIQRFTVRPAVNKKAEKQREMEEKKESPSPQPREEKTPARKEKTPPPEQQSPPPEKKEKQKKKKPATVEDKMLGEKQEPTDEEQRKEAYRIRLTRFYTKYAPHKLAIVDAALTMYEGREEEMFFTLIRKYGPEPSPDEDLDNGPPSTTTDATNNSNSKQSTRKEETPARSSKQSKKEKKEEPPEQQQQQQQKQEQQPSSAKKKEKEKEEKEEEPPAAKPSTPPPSSKEKKGEDGQKKKEQDEQQQQQPSEDKHKEKRKEETPSRKEKKEAPPPKEEKAEDEDTKEKEKERKDAEEKKRKEKEDEEERQREKEKEKEKKAAEEKRKKDEEEKEKKAVEEKRKKDEEEKEKKRKEEEAKRNQEEERKEKEKEKEQAASADSQPKEETKPAESAKEPEKKDEKPAATSESPPPPKEEAQKEGPAVDLTYNNPYKARLERFCKKYAPEKLELVDQLLTTYVGREEKMMNNLVKRYGPEPEADE